MQLALGGSSSAVQSAGKHIAPEPVGTDSSDATEQAIDNWQVHHWPYSNECKQLIRVLLALRASGWQSALQTMLAQNLPPFLFASREDAFLGVLEDETISDGNLRESIVDFYARGLLRSCHYSSRHRCDLPTVRDLLDDTAVAGEANVLWPEDFPMKRWITSRLHGDVELKEKQEEL